MNANDFSIDVKALSTRFDAPVLSIGVAQFNRNTGEIGKTFYREIRVESALQYGVVNAATLRWWMHQTDPASLKLFEDLDKYSLPQALIDLSKFIPKGAFIWGNGASVAITIMEYAYAKVGQSPPWETYDIRDMRTVVDLAAYETGALKLDGSPNNALAMSMHLAKVISFCIQRLGGKSKGVQTTGMPPPGRHSAMPPPASLDEADDLL